MASLFAVSDLHVRHAENRAIVASIAPERDTDWLIVAGDVGEHVEDVEWALGILRPRFERVIWVPGNHELWTTNSDPVRLRGEARYQHLVGVCRDLEVLTPEDPYPVWCGSGGPVTIVPMFLLYDYSFRPPGTRTKAEGLAAAEDAGVLCTDEYLLDPTPFAGIDAWCDARTAYTEKRLADLPAGTRTVLVNHYPLTRDPLAVLRFPEFALWCGTDRTGDWHLRYAAVAVVYGHLHIPRRTERDGVTFYEVSLGYPGEWRSRGHAPRVPRRILGRTP